jgi:hypothetical protein
MKYFITQRTFNINYVMWSGAGSKFTDKDCENLCLKLEKVSNLRAPFSSYASSWALVL